MKKSILKVTSLIALALGMLVSCTTEEDVTPSSTFVVTPTDFKGTITSGEVI